MLSPSLMSRQLVPLVVWPSKSRKIFLVADGRLFWIQDAYTVTRRYPYATRWEGRFNYIRNSVKATIDAYDGTMTFYVVDDADPIVQTYRKIFPDLAATLAYLKESAPGAEDAFGLLPADAGGG